MLHFKPMNSYSALGTVPVSPQRMPQCAKGPVNNLLRTSALAMCTSSIITVLIPFIASANASECSSLLFFSSTFNDCHVAMVLNLPSSFLSMFFVDPDPNTEPSNYSCNIVPADILSTSISVLPDVDISFIVFATQDILTLSVVSHLSSSAYVLNCGWSCVCKTFT